MNQKARYTMLGKMPVALQANEKGLIHGGAQNIQCALLKRLETHTKKHREFIKFIDALRDKKKVKEEVKNEALFI